MKPMLRLLFIPLLVASLGNPGNAADSEVLLELRRINESLGRIERLLSQTTLDGSKSAGLSRASATEGNLVKSGCITRHYRMEAFNTVAFSLPKGEPDVQQEFEGGRFCPNEVREKFGYPEDAHGIVSWEGDYRFPAGKMEFQFGWGLRPYGNSVGLGSITLRSVVDGQTMELQNTDPISKPDLVTAELEAGTFRLRFVGPTNTIGFPAEGGNLQPNYLILQYREAGSGGAWITVTPSMLMMPSS
jgi:hypothetical protein